MDYAKGLTITVKDEELWIWLEGEDLEENPQFTVTMSGNGEEEYAMVGVGELSDGIPASDLEEICKAVKKFEQTMLKHKKLLDLSDCER